MISAQVTWPASAYVDSGSGTFTYWLRFEGTHSGNSVTSLLTECGRLVPDRHSSASNEIHAHEYPNSLFDTVPSLLASVPATATLSDSSPGASFTLPSTALLTGTTLADPIGGDWPDAASGLTPVDTDADGKPGVTAMYRDDGSYTLPRAGPTILSPRADLRYGASRLVFALSGTVTSCAESSGSANVTFVNDRVFGCRRALTSQDCDSSQSNFLDGNVVDYTPGSATYTLLKLADGATCANVRAAL
jgi:hypothetical protein